MDWSTTAGVMVVLMDSRVYIVIMDHWDEVAC
jgi:hypothetical protein